MSDSVARILHFSSPEPLGTLRIKEPGAAEWLPLTQPAMGDVAVAIDAEVALDVLPLNVRSSTVRHLDGLDSLGPDDLAALTLAGCELCEEDVETLRHLTGLRHLNLGMSNVTGTWLERLDCLTQLEELSLKATKIDDAALRNVALWPRLRHLNLSRTKITGGGLAALSAAQDIWSLFLDRTMLEDRELLHLQNLPRLERLHLNDTPIGDRGLALLAGCTKLIEVELSRSAITNITDKMVGGLQKLKRLKVGDTRLTGGSISILANLQSLEELGLSVTMTDDAAIADLAPLRSLRKLEIGKTCVTGRGLAYLRPLLMLQDLDWGSNRQIITSEAAFSVGFSALTYLCVDYTPLQPEDFRDVSRVPLLRRLEASKTNLSDPGLRYLSESTSLRTLLAIGTNVTDEGILQLQNTNLEWLSVGRTQVTEAGAQALRRALPTCIVML